MAIKQILLWLLCTLVSSRKMNGRILGLARRPIQGLNVTVNGEVKAVSGPDGVFELDIEGTVTLDVESEFNFFNPLKISSMQEDDMIKDLIATGVGLCGSIKMFDQNLELRTITSENDSFKRKIFM